ncbi:hypothetical protein [Lysinibacillus sp. RC79]|uniref:hypothetical protein n=1 Tax=unclassified Lysinibacillus TaxID=2636778 RepID=UPI0035148F22
MEIVWKREDFIFDTIRESEVWADSISNEMFGRTISGYITPDYKIAYSLAFFLAQIDEFQVHTKNFYEKESGLDLYKIWVSYKT